MEHKELTKKIIGCAYRVYNIINWELVSLKAIGEVFVNRETSRLDY